MQMKLTSDRARLSGDASVHLTSLIPCVGSAVLTGSGRQPVSVKDREGKRSTRRSPFSRFELLDSSLFPPPCLASDCPEVGCLERCNSAATCAGFEICRKLAGELSIPNTCQIRAHAHCWHSHLVHVLGERLILEGEKNIY